MNIDLCAVIKEIRKDYSLFDTYDEYTRCSILRQEPQLIEELGRELTDAELLNVFPRCPKVLRDIKEVSSELLSSIASYSPINLKLIEDKLSQDDLLDLVSTDPELIRYITQSPGLCKAAVAKNGYVIKYIKNPSADLYRIAVDSIPTALSYVPEEFVTEEMVLGAVNKFPRVILEVENPTDNMVRTSFKVSKDFQELLTIYKNLSTLPEELERFHTLDKALLELNINLSTELIGDYTSGCSVEKAVLRVCLVNGVSVFNIPQGIIRKGFRDELFRSARGDVLEGIII